MSESFDPPPPYSHTSDNQFNSGTPHPCSQPVQQPTSQPPPPPNRPNAFWSGSNLTPTQLGYNPSQRYNPPTQQYQPSPSSSNPVNLPYLPSIVPSPNQPLLNDGRILIYPLGFTCPKCKNTGVKTSATHPCKTCWEKYSKPYSAAIRIALSSGRAPPNYQARLPNFQNQTSSRPAFSSSNNQYRQNNGHPGHQSQSYRQPIQTHSNYIPPGSIVVQPGDSRIGGQLCRRCGGRGITIGWLEDDTCKDCKGSGRVFW